MLGEQILSAIRKYSVKNALEYGKANEKSVFGKVISEFPETKSDMKGLMSEIARIVSEVGKLDRASLEREFEEHREEFEKAQQIKAKESVPKFVLEGAIKGDFATRYAPAPNGYMHIGHAKAALMASEFAKIYEGKIFLYFDDTNPEKDRQEYVDAMKEDLAWLGIRFDDEYYASDNIELIYGHARELLGQGNAYACECEAELVSKNRFAGIECEHRARASGENLRIFEDMLGGKYDEGKVAIRFRGDMKSQNTALRDPVILRIKRGAHYRQGERYIVWPTYDLNTPIMDSMHGVTDVIRSKEFELRDELARMILRALKLGEPRIHSESRLVIVDNITHKRELNKLIAKGELWGYDDPRLVTISALRRRGIVPEAIRKFVLRSGMSKTDGKMDISMLLDENRKAVDKIAKRLFFVEDPVKVKIEGGKRTMVRMSLLPENDAEFREYDVGNTLYISRKDSEALAVGDKIRFKDLFNVEVSNLKGDITCKFIGGDQKGTKTVQWVSEGNYISAKLVIPGKLLIDGEFNKDSLAQISGLAEGYTQNVRQGEIVQFERIGFFRLDDKGQMLFIGS
ncbi:MAG: glutamate--tRNA ligase [Candidatus Micrarchaeota archaeon]|nr:glutamate--tRNA ligase [Candidatus Micrarchaeota archaeon]